MQSTPLDLPWTCPQRVARSRLPLACTFDDVSVPEVSLEDRLSSNFGRFCTVGRQFGHFIFVTKTVTKINFQEKQFSSRLWSSKWPNMGSLILSISPPRGRISKNDDRDCVLRPRDVLLYLQMRFLFSQFRARPLRAAWGYKSREKGTSGRPLGFSTDLI